MKPEMIVAVGLLILGLLALGTVGPRLAVFTREEQPAPPEGMVLVPAGVFHMGSAFREGGRDERPVHRVYVSGFYMDAYEVTKALWDEVASWALDHGYDIQPSDGWGKATDHPVFVSWYTAVKWCNARSEKEGLTPCYYTDAACLDVYRTGRVDVRSEWVNWTANGYRLPTEAEWEKAARGGCRGRRFPWCDTDTIEHARANFYSASSKHRTSARYAYDRSATRGPHPTYRTGDQPYTSPVGSFAPNGYGLFDMAGNVSEWCWDWYGEACYTALPRTNPRGPSEGSHRVHRGGDWGFGDAARCRVASRSRTSPGDLFFGWGLGFRPVRAAP